MMAASRLVLFLLGCVIAYPAAAQQIRGSGSTFVYPVLAKWSDAYQKVSGAHVAYQPLGSSGGIVEINAGVVDFAISDAPLEDYQLLRDGLAQFPVVMGAIVPVVNLDGIAAGQFRFTGELLADIFLGKVKNWSDPAIAAANPGVRLPDKAILVVHRSDGSGTTFNWTDYLSKVSGEWKARVGSSTLVAWPTGAGGKGNGGVAENVARVKGAIGYVEYGYAQRKKLTYALVRNRAGNFVPPDMASFQAATVDVDWQRARGFQVSLTDAPRPDAYPIMAASFVLIHQYPKDAPRRHDVLAFFGWALENGRDMASSLDYLALSPPIVEVVEGYWDREWGFATKQPSLVQRGTPRPG
jgi:phosphate transport system substrate-binding protein